MRGYDRKNGERDAWPSSLHFCAPTTAGEDDDSGTDSEDDDSDSDDETGTIKMEVTMRIPSAYPLLTIRAESGESRLVNLFFRGLHILLLLF